MPQCRLSVLDLVPILEQASPKAAIEQAALLAQTAERLGYARYWIAEHHDMPAIVSSSPEVLLAHIGARTERIRIGSGAVLLPYYKPYKVAETFHMLATLYPGRIDLGVGRAPGGSAHVSMALADNYLEQVRRLPESLEALTALLADEFRVDDSPVSARPVPAVPPELWLLGTNVKSADYAARFGAGYAFGHFMSDADGKEIVRMYKDGFRPSRPADEPRVSIAVSVVCAETDERAQSLARQGAELIFGVSSAESGYDAAKARKSVVGAPERVRERLLEMRDEYGADEFIVVTTAPDYISRLRSYELLARALL
ncbi:LLM class flavin-dependent oxidoreductase [Paenibacillus sp. GYB003]